MAKPIQNKWLHTRIDEDLDNRVRSYIEATDLNMATFVKKAVEEYLRTHPIKTPQKSDLEKLKPGEDD